MDSIISMKKNKIKMQLNYIWMIAIIVVFSAIITTTGFFLQPNDFSQIISTIFEHPAIFILNFIPVFIAAVFLCFLFNNAFYSVALVALLFHIGALINRYKIIYRDDPFVPLDIFLGAEAAKIASDTKLQIDYVLLSLAIIFSIVLIILGSIIKFKKLKGWMRVVGVSVAIVLALLSNTFIYSSREIYDRMPTKSKAYVTGVFNDLGFVYCFFYNLNAYKLEAPNNYSKRNAQNLINKYTLDKSKTPSVKPNVIIIMNEAFSDVTLANEFIFSEPNNPLKNYKEIIASKNAVSGHMIVPNFGGGTANTEFDVLTGIQTTSLSSVPTSSFRLVRKNMNSVPRFFTDNGYKDLFIHPGDDWFYNRANVYKFLGMGNQIFIKDFKKPDDYKGALVSDKATGEKIIEQFRANLKMKDAKPLFNYTVTIQNHMPYSEKKYGYKAPNVYTNSKLSPEAKDILNTYVVGIRDADQMLKRLTDYFNQRDEPVVLVFFGDHKPFLGENFMVYKELGIEIDENGTIEQRMNSFQVPYLIWSNNSAYQKLNFPTAVKRLELPKDGVISANYLGPIVMELLGYKGKNPYYDFLNELRRKVPVITQYYYKTGDSYEGDNYIEKLPTELAAKVNDFRIWEYYKMDGEKVK